MRTRTIFEARIRAGLRYAAGFHDRAERQVGTFNAELLRRMDERDEMVAPRQVFLTPERIGQYMASLSDDIKADDILRGGK